MDAERIATDQRLPTAHHPANSAQEELALFASRQRFRSDDGLPTSSDAVSLSDAQGVGDAQKENSPPPSIIHTRRSPHPNSPRHGAGHSPAKALLWPNLRGGADSAVTCARAEGGPAHPAVLGGRDAVATHSTLGSPSHLSHPPSVAVRCTGMGQSASAGLRVLGDVTAVSPRLGGEGYVSVDLPPGGSPMAHTPLSAARTDPSLWPPGDQGPGATPGGSHAGFSSCVLPDDVHQSPVGSGGTLVSASGCGGNPGATGCGNATGPRDANAVASHPLPGSAGSSRGASASPPQRVPVGNAPDGGATHGGHHTPGVGGKAWAAPPDSPFFTLPETDATLAAGGGAGSDGGAGPTWVGPTWVAFQDVAADEGGVGGTDAGAVCSAFAPLGDEEGWEDGEPRSHSFDRVYLTFGGGDRQSSGVVGPPLDSRPSERGADRFQVQEGEDAEIKQLLWVVENLQEELMAANEARIEADAQLPALKKTLESLQDEMESVVSARDEVEEEMMRLQLRLADYVDIKTRSDEAYRQSTAELRAIQERTGEVDVEIAAKTARMDSLKKRVAEIKRAAGGAKPGAAASEPRSRSLADLGSDSDGSHMSSTWGTDSESDDEQQPSPLPQAVVDSSPGVRVTQLLQPAPDAFRRPSLGPASSGWLRGVFGKATEGSAEGPDLPSTPGAQA